MKRDKWRMENGQMEFSRKTDERQKVDKWQRRKKGFGAQKKRENKNYEGGGKNKGKKRGQTKTKEGREA